uniref:Reverse transcriptase domain-containing protein n=1 Tax=Lactuca sativa TaxID=4236 RepID=A0A9R1XKS4_LACSA|nr:hypothetical protein LSAT_V11C400221010 [Lactuca sativa]
MPFGLKKAGATYQRLMEKVFANQIDRNIKFYVDEMVIKSRNEEELLRDVEETFQTTAKSKMKLNPEFLESKAPHNLKGVQEISGRLMTLGRFIAKSSDKALPLYQTLKVCLEKNMIKWKKEVDATLQKLRDVCPQIRASQFRDNKHQK